MQIWNKNVLAIKRAGSLWTEICVNDILLWTYPPFYRLERSSKKPLSMKCSSLFDRNVRFVTLQSEKRYTHTVLDFILTVLRSSNYTFLDSTHKSFGSTHTFLVFTHIPLGFTHTFLSFTHISCGCTQTSLGSYSRSFGSTHTSLSSTHTRVVRKVLRQYDFLCF